jgi:hypothetical protein
MGAESHVAAYWTPPAEITDAGRVRELEAAFANSWKKLSSPARRVS